jgi:Suppressor of fused protein (SUFU)
MQLDEYKKRYGNDDEAAPGWDAIDERLKPLYPDQEPMHWGTAISYMLGGPDPLDGISMYQCSDGPIPHLHFATYGFTSLYYDEESVGGEYSQFGFELTFRLASPFPPCEPVEWVCNFLQNLARYVFDTKKHFAAGHWIPANGPIRAESDTAIVGLAFLDDPRLPPINSPHGRVEFVQGFGLTQPEIDSLINKTDTVDAILERHRRGNPLLVTDLSRPATA